MELGQPQPVPTSSNAANPEEDDSRKKWRPPWQVRLFGDFDLDSVSDLVYAQGHLSFAQRLLQHEQWERESLQNQLATLAETRKELVRNLQLNENQPDWKRELERVEGDYHRVNLKYKETTSNEANLVKMSNDAEARVLELSTKLRAMGPLYSKAVEMCTASPDSSTEGESGMVLEENVNPGGNQGQKRSFNEAEACPNDDNFKRRREDGDLEFEGEGNMEVTSTTD